MDQDGTWTWNERLLVSNPEAAGSAAADEDGEQISLLSLMNPV